MYYTSQMKFPEETAVDSRRTFKEFKKNFCAKNKPVILSKYKASVIEKYIRRRIFVILVHNRVVSKYWIFWSVLWV